MSNGMTTLHRPTEGRWLAGVAAGLGLRSGVPVWIIRIGFALLCFAGGLGVLLYVAGWLLIPGEGEAEAIVQGWLGPGQARRWFGVALVGLAVVILASETRLIRGELALAVVLIGVGVMLYRGDLGGGDRSPGARPPTDPGASPDERGEQPEGASATSPAPAPATPPEPSYLGRFSVGLAVMALGVLGLLDTVIPGLNPGFRHYAALPVAVIGLGLVIGAWFGRPGALAVLGVVSVSVLLLSPLPDFVGGRSVEFDFTASREVRYRPASVGEIPESYRLGAGALLIDLRGVDFAGRTVEMDARVGAGEVRVLIPESLSADVRGRVGMGVLQVGDWEKGGIGVEGRYRLEGPDGVLVLDADVGLGEIEVVRYGEAHERRVYHRIDEVDELQDAYTLDTGSLVIDLGGLELDDRDAYVAIRVGEGDVWLTFPERVNRRVTVQVERGRYILFEESKEGRNLYTVQTVHRTSGPELAVDILVGQGSVVVEEGR